MGGNNMIYLVNGISSSMLHDPNVKELRYSLSKSEFTDLINNVKFRSIIGHRQLAEVLTEITNKEIAYNRQAIRLDYSDYLLLVSIDGRLPEHPNQVDYEGKLRFYFVRFEKQSIEEMCETLSIINNLKEDS